MALSEMSETSVAAEVSLARVVAIQEALALSPGDATLWKELGIALADLGQLAMAMDATRTALSLQPDAVTHSNLIWFQDHDDSQTLADRQRARQAWWLEHIVPLQCPTPIYTNLAKPLRRLRLGYVMPTPVTTELLEQLSEHDHQAYEVFAYAATVASAQGLHWRNVSALDDAAFAAQVMADQIDILVDLCGHAPGNRLPVFARRPAPVQVSLSAGTGMLEITAVLQVGTLPSDAEQCLFAEQPLYAPDLSIATLEKHYRELWQAWCDWQNNKQLSATFDRKLQAAVVAHQSLDLAQAITAYQELLSRQRKHPDVLHLLGLIYLTNDYRNPDAGELLIARAVALSPGSADYLGDLGLAYQAGKRFDLAEQCFVQACELDPLALRLRLNHINLLRDCQRFDEALALYDELLSAQPEHVDLHYNRAITYWLAGNIHAALSGLVKCLSLNPRYEDAHHTMVSLLEGEPDHAATRQAFQNTLAANPFAPQLHSVIAYSSDFDGALDAAGQQRVRKSYDAQQIAPQHIAPLTLTVSREPEKKLRIGFIPGRFYRNASVYAYLPILLQLERDEFEVWCYDNFPQVDDFTAQIKARADGWRDITQLSDAEAAQQIRDDKIDILIDLFAHAGANRLPIYAYRPAPVQVTAWGHANGTGMTSVDYLFSDPVSIPPAETALYAEHVHYLPCQLSYWLPEIAPPLAPLPLLRKGYITFGCFNRMIKVSDAVLELWMTLLQQVPDSHLLLKAAELAEAPQRERVIAMFKRYDIPLSRLEFYTGSPWYEHLQLYADVDIALDPFPMGGGVTTLDALWMGIPVVCLRGHTLGQRITSAIMTAVGLPDWVSDTPQGYLQLVQDKARDVQSLQQLRASMRMRMAASPLANPDYYVGCVEDALRSFWRTWCASPDARLPQPHEAKFAIGEHARAADQLWQDFLLNPDSADVRQRLVASMNKAGKHVLAAEFSARAD